MKELGGSGTHEELLDKIVKQQAHLLLGVENSAHIFRLASINSQNATGRSLQIAIPFGTPVTLIVASSFFQVTGPAGPVPASAAAQIPLLVRVGQQPTVVNFTVTGGGR